MKIRSGKMKAILLAGMLGLSMTFAPQMTGQATELAVRETVEQEAASGRIIIGVEGVDLTSAQKDLIDRINAVRKAACEDGITPDPRDSSRMLQPSDYVEMKIGVNCTKAAVVRAAEAAVFLSHTRPNGTSWKEVHKYYNTSNSSRAENLAWDYIKGTSIDGWIDERDAYLGKSSGQTGHYKTLINPNYQYTGLSTFNPVNDTVSYDWSCTAGAYAESDVAVSSYAAAQNETVIQKIEVPVSAVTKMDIAGNAMLEAGGTDTLQLLVKISFPDGVSPNTTMDCPVYDGVEWSSSDTSVLSIGEDGTLSVKKAGTATVTAAIGTGADRQEVTREFVAASSGVTVTGAEDPEMITVESGKAPVLPKTVNATLSNGSKVALNVIWEDYDEKNLDTRFKSSEFDISGTVSGYPVTQKVHVNAAKMTKTYTDPETVTTDSGVEPEYPQAFVVMSNGMEYIDLQVKWDQESREYYKNRDGGTFELKGETAYGFETDEGTVHFPVTAGLTVNPATITGVVFDEKKLVTQSGIEPAYPKASVEWSNGDTEQEDITWTKTEAFLSAYRKREGGTYTIKGTLHGKNTAVTVEVLPATVTAVAFDDQEIHVENGTCPVLPKQAQVTWSNGDTEQAVISWEELPEEKYNNLTGGSFEVKGTVAGETVKVSCVAAAPVILKIQDFEPVETVEGVKPELPEQAQVTWNNGQLTSEQIVWKEAAEPAYRTPGETFTVGGHLKNHSDTNREVQIAVSVRAKSLMSLKWKQNGAKNPSGTDCYDRYDWSKVGGTVIAQYDNGTEEPLDLKDERLTVSGYEETSAEASQAITLSYSYGQGSGKVTKTLSVTMVLHLPESSTVAAPIKTDYVEGQSLDLTGLAVELLYDDGKKVTRTYGDGEVEIALLDENGAVADREFLKAGACRLLVKLDDFEEEIPITVHEKASAENGNGEEQTAGEAGQTTGRAGQAAGETGQTTGGAGQAAGGNEQTGAERTEENSRTDTSAAEEGTTGNGGADEGRPETSAGTTSESQIGTKDNPSEMTIENPTGAKDSPSGVATGSSGGTKDSPSEVTTENPSGGKDTPAGSTENPSGGKDTPAKSTENPSGGKDTPAGSTENLSGGKDTPAGSTENPSGGKGISTGTTENPSGGKGTPAGSTENPSGGKGKSTGTTENPSGSKGTSAGTTEARTGIKESSGVTATEMNDRTTEEEKTQAMRPGSVSVSKVTAKKKGFTVRWKKGAADVTGYQLQYSMNKNFKTGRKTILITKRNAVSKTVRKLKTRKKYYIRVRTFRVAAGEKYYSDWSKVKMVRTK